MSNYIPNWEPPDPPQESADKSIITCPFCGSEEVGIVTKRIIKGKLITEYECYDCDKEWVKTNETVDDDDIPF